MSVLCSVGSWGLRAFGSASDVVSAIHFTEGAGLIERSIAKVSIVAKQLATYGRDSCRSSKCFCRNLK